MICRELQKIHSAKEKKFDSAVAISAVPGWPQLEPRPWSIVILDHLGVQIGEEKWLSRRTVESIGEHQRIFATHEAAESIMVIDHHGKSVTQVHRRDVLPPSGVRSG